LIDCILVLRGDKIFGATKNPAISGRVRLNFTL
jgi:hypothetical protein